MSGLRINRTHYPVTVLGHGVRAGIWVQGCTIGCSGCVSRDTWDAGGGAEVDVAVILDWLDGIEGRLDGVTISGGEPFQQPDALAELLDGLARWRRGRQEELDVLVYSGYPWAKLNPRFATLLERCDAVIAGPYVGRRNTGVPLRGSDNQQIVMLSELGERRYRDPEAEQRMQVEVSGNRVYCIGIPRAGDMDRLTEQLADWGVLLGDLAWRA